MISSPFMVIYGNLLLVLQYIWSFELPEIKKVPGFLEKKEPGELASKVSEQENTKTKLSNFQKFSPRFSDVCVLGFLIECVYWDLLAPVYVESQW